MMSRLLPKTFDNTYQGSKLALWLFAFLIASRTIMGMNIMLNGEYVARSADGIPLDTFPAAAAQTALGLFAIFAVDHVMICLLCVLVLVRYRSMIPLMFALLLLEHLGRKLILYFIPIVRVGTPPGFHVNLGLLVVTIVGLVLSLWSQSKQADSAPAAAHE